MAKLDLGKVVGESASVSVGTTTTLQAGQNASVENVGTTQNAIFNFGIPKGADGTNGTNGTDGYSPSASVSQSGSITTITITDKNGTTTANINLSGYATENYVNNAIGNINSVLATLTTPDMPQVLD